MWAKEVGQPKDKMSTFVKGGLQKTFKLCSKSLSFSLGGLFGLLANEGHEG